MFLPVLLVRDFGVWGFVAFGVPNCLGAAAMGWVLRSPAHSAELVNRHAPAMRLFSVVTVLFHVFFLAWLASWTRLPFRAEALIGLSAVVGALVALMKHRWQGWLGVALWAGVAGVILVTLLGTGAGDHRILPASTDLPPREVLYLAPVCLFGFALCPYLDLTFNRARQSLPSPASGAGAFALGFLFFFPTMILFTLIYAGVFLFNKNLSIALICVHMAIQAGYTVGVHAQALVALAHTQRASRDTTAPGSISAAPQLLTSVLLAFLACAIAFFVHKRELGACPPGQFGLPEIIYRCFMAFYGLVFPAYVWICMIPTRTSRTNESHAGISGSIGQRKFWTLMVAIAAASPFYYLGFIERQSHWLAVGVGLVLIARLIAARPGGMAK